MEVIVDEVDLPRESVTAALTLALFYSTVFRSAIRGINPRHERRATVARLFQGITKTVGATPLVQVRHLSPALFADLAV